MIPVEILMTADKSDPTISLDELITKAADGLGHLRLHEAIACCEEALLRPEIEEPQITDVYRILINALIAGDQLAQAEVRTGEWMSHAKTDVSRMHALIEHANVLLRIGKFAEGFQILDEAQSLVGQVGDRPALGRILRYRADILWTQGNSEKALFLLQQALAIQEILKDNTQQIAVLISMSIVYDVMGRPWDAIMVSERAVHLCEELQDMYSLTIIYNNIGEWYQRIFAMDKALSYHQKASGLQGEMHSVDLERNLGVDLVAMGRHDEGLQRLRHAVDMGRRGDRDELMQALYSLAEGLFNLHELAEARTVATELYTMAKALGAERHIARASLLLGYLVSAEGSVNAAHPYFQEAFITGQKTSDLNIVWQTHAAMADKYADTQPVMADLYRAIAADALESIAQNIMDAPMRTNFLHAPPVARVLKKRDDSPF